MMKGKNGILTVLDSTFDASVDAGSQIQVKDGGVLVLHNSLLDSCSKIAPVQTNGEASICNSHLTCTNPSDCSLGLDLRLYPSKAVTVSHLSVSGFRNGIRLLPEEFHDADDQASVMLTDVGLNGQGAEYGYGLLLKGKIDTVLSDIRISNYRIGIGGECQINISQSSDLRLTDNAHNWGCLVATEEATSTSSPADSLPSPGTEELASSTPPNHTVAQTTYLLAGQWSNRAIFELCLAAKINTIPGNSRGHYACWLKL